MLLLKTEMTLLGADPVAVERVAEEEAGALLLAGAEVAAVVAAALFAATELAAGATAAESVARTVSRAGAEEVVLEEDAAGGEVA